MMNTVMLGAFQDEMVKIAATRRLASLGLPLDELHKLAETNEVVYELLKQAGLYRKVVDGTRSAYNAAQTELGSAMAGSGRYGHHGGEIARGLPHAAMAGAAKGGSLGAAALHLAPEVIPALTPAAKRAAGAVGSAVRKATPSVQDQVRNAPRRSQMGTGMAFA